MADVTIPGGTADLANAARNLAVIYSGKNARILLDLHDQLTDDVIRLIKMQLKAEEPAYATAASAIQDASEYIGDGMKKIDDIAKGIDLLKKVADAVVKLVTLA